MLEFFSHVISLTTSLVYASKEHLFISAYQSSPVSLFSYSCYSFTLQLVWAAKLEEQQKKKWMEGKSDEKNQPGIYL